MDLSPEQLADNEGSKTAHFATAIVRAREALAMLDALPPQSGLKQIGMALGSILFRLRELSARWPADVNAVTCGPPTEVGGCLRQSRLKPTADEPALADIACSSADLDRRAGLLAVSLECSDLHGAKPLLDDLLKRLPAVQEKITRRIYQQDLNA